MTLQQLLKGSSEWASYSGTYLLLYQISKLELQWDLQYKSWLELVFLWSQIRERRGEGLKVSAAKNKKCDTDFGLAFRYVSV